LKAGNHFPFADICLKTNVGIADSLYNLQLVKGFCENKIPSHCFHLTYEDFLYTSNTLLPNFYSLLAELFYWIEVQKLDCVASTPGQYFTEEGTRNMKYWKFSHFVLLCE